MDTQKKLYISILVLAGMGGALYLQKKKQHAEADPTASVAHKLSCRNSA
jgi:hypothetical protein